jgi:enamine deaminase RidA (YjgF/YER057c/UK114 family)
LIEVAGTAGLVDGRPAASDAYEQARRALELIAAAVEQLGGGLEDVVRTRMFVVDIARNAEQVGRAHGEFFGDIRPATAMYGVDALIRDDLLVEIEATAVVTGDRSHK